MGINCDNFVFQEDAQAYFDAHPGDPEGLDGPIGPTSAGVPGLACEDLPRRGGGTSNVTTATTSTTAITAPITTPTTQPVTATTVAPRADLVTLARTGRSSSALATTAGLLLGTGVVLVLLFLPGPKRRRV